MANIIVQNVQAADPEASFQVVFDTPPNSAVSIRVTMTGPHGNKYISDLNIQNAVTETVLNCTIPFGDGNYKSGTDMEYDIFVVAGSLGMVASVGTVVAQ